MEVPIGSYLISITLYTESIDRDTYCAAGGRPIAFLRYTLSAKFENYSPYHDNIEMILILPLGIDTLTIA